MPEWHEIDRHDEYQYNSKKLASIFALETERL